MLDLCVWFFCVPWSYVDKLWWICKLSPNLLFLLHLTCKQPWKWECRVSLFFQSRLQSTLLIASSSIWGMSSFPSRGTNPGVSSPRYTEDEGGTAPLSCSSAGKCWTRVTQTWLATGCPDLPFLKEFMNNTMTDERPHIVHFISMC